MEKNNRLSFWIDNKIKILILLTLPFLVYLNTLGNRLVSDDIPYITKDPNIGNFLSGYNFQTIKGFFYTWDHFWSGVEPISYHLTNLAIHLIVVVLAFYFLSQIVSRDLAFWASLVFAVHPLNSESVTWISGRAYPLYVLFLLLALLTFLKARAKTGLNRWHFLTALFFWLAASVNSFAIAFPLIIFTYELSSGNLKQSLRPIFFYFFLALTRVVYISPLITTRVEFLGLQANPTVSQNQNFFSALISLWNYIYLFLFPRTLSFYHEDLSGPYQLRYPLLLLTLIVVGLLPFLYKRWRIGFFALLFYAFSLAATLAPIKVSWIVAERYSYLGSLGLALAFVSILILVFERLKLSQNGRYLILGALVLSLSTRTFLRNFDWKNEDTLWIATAQSSPTSSKAWNNMGDYYGRHNDAQKSFEAFVRATQINPNYADAWHNAGNVLLQSGKTNDSVPYFEKSLEFNPNLIEAYDNLAMAYHRLKNREKSMGMIKKSLEINPNSAKTYTALTVIEYEDGHPQAAFEALTKAASLDPQNPILKQNLQILQNEIKQKNRT